MPSETFSPLGGSFFRLEAVSRSLRLFALPQSPIIAINSVDLSECLPQNLLNL